MKADMWIDDDEYNLTFESQRDFDSFKYSLDDAFKEGERFCYPSKGVYIYLKEVKFIHIYEVEL